MKNAATMLTIAWLTVAIAGCGGGGGGGAAAAAPPPAPAPPPGVSRGTLLNDNLALYPRAVRLAAQADSARNGQLIASVTTSVGGVLQAGIWRSSDNGASFTALGAVADAEFAKGLCCGTLFELPQAVGALPAGTLLYAASVGADLSGTVMENRIHRSDDGGATWRFLSVCGRGRVARVGGRNNGIWEPEFSMAATGELVCHYADETVPGKSQVLAYVKSSDGITWSAPQLTVAGDNANQRPGMPVVRKLPGGKYFMVFENCFGGPLDCSVRAKLSDDGLNWGAANDLGRRLETASGQFFRHAPTVAWAPVAGQPNGMLMVIGQILFDGSGAVDAAGNGKTMLINTNADGSGAWRVVATPIALANPPLVTHFCPNYSSPLLPLPNGTLVMMQSDYGSNGDCRVRFGSGALPTP
jgi:hypothetical protein